MQLNEATFAKSINDIQNVEKFISKLNIFDSSYTDPHTGIKLYVHISINKYALTEVVDQRSLTGVLQNPVVL